MIGLVALEAVALVVIVVLFLRAQDKREAEVRQERAELLNRIQHPERVPAQAVELFSYEPEDHDEIELVGAILEPKDDE